MKTQEEIEQLALQRFPNDTPSGLKIGTSSYKQRGYIKGYTQCQEDMSKDQKVTRFEVIDENGRAYTEHYCKVELSYQDDGRTLKVFIKKQD